MLLEGYAGSETLFIITDILAYESFDKRRQSLLKLPVSGKQRNHYLWLLTQYYSVIPKNLKKQAKAIFVWYSNEKTDLKIIQYENYVLTNNELVIVRGLLKESKHACLYIRNEHPRGFKYLKMNMGKTSKKVTKVTKDPKRPERGKKSHESYIKKAKGRYTME